MGSEPTAWQGVETTEDEAASGDVADPGRPLGPPLTFTRLLGAFILNCVLFFGIAVVFSWLGPLGLTPAIVISTVLTGRITRIRRMSALILIGALTLVVMVVLIWLMAVVVVLNNPELRG